jgi:tetratricopeptide (TPR) repeat protein
VGDEIVIREGSTLWRSESGQGVINFTADQANRTVPFARKTAAPATSPPVEADDWYDLACELEVNAPHQAQDAYQRALELDPSHGAARVNLGRLLHEDGHPLAAANHYRLALAARPDDPIAAFNLGVALEDLGRATEAIAAYEQAVAADPAAADAHFNLAGLYEKEGKAAGAIRHLKAYRKLTQGR